MKKADYVLAVKDNQKRLHEAITDYFEVAIATDSPDVCQLQFHTETHAEHGRIEIRRCYLSTCLDTLPDASRWKGLKSKGGDFPAFWQKQSSFIDVMEDFYLRMRKNVLKGIWEPLKIQFFALSVLVRY